MQIEQKQDKILVHKRAYIKNLLEMYKMENCNAVATPMDIN